MNSATATNHKRPVLAPMTSGQRSKKGFRLPIHFKTLSTLRLWRTTACKCSMPKTQEWEGEWHFGSGSELKDNLELTTSGQLRGAVFLTA